MTKHPQFKAYAALLSVYFFWGTTYLGIRIALETFPPFILMAVRFLTSGAIMLIGARLLKIHIPRGRELVMTALFGMLGLGIGNGTLVYAETMIPSGTAALFITTAPFWMVGIETLLPGGERLHLPSLIGIVVGFMGVLLLVAPTASGSEVGHDMLRGFLILQAGCLAWNLGALLQRRQPTAAHPVISGAVQQLAVGFLFLPIAAIVPAHPIQWSTRGVLALAYLVVFGSIVGYSSFIYAMEHLPVPIVSTYNYVNPIVAVFLGWLFYREPFGPKELFAMAAVFTGVALVKYYSGRAPRRASAKEA